MTATPDAALLRWGLRLEYATFAWNVAGSAIVLVAAVLARDLRLRRRSS